MLLARRRSQYPPIAVPGQAKREREPAALSACILCWSLCATGCQKAVTAEECTLLLDRYVTLLITSDRPDLDDAEARRLKAEAHEKAERDPAFKECPERVTRHQFRCAIEATSADQFEQCLL